MKKLAEHVLARLGRRLHHEEHGAIALLCLASILILFMLILIMFDASQTTQAKIDVQMGADTAAYSAGATGARAMNMVAFANVGKRTAMGINNMYVFEYPTYVAWVSYMCSCCCTCSVFCCPDFTCCRNCAGNGLSLIPVVEAFDYFDYILGNDIFDNMVQLNEYQEAVSDIAKAWSVGEAQARGIRNNANMMVVWPDPRDDDHYQKLPIALSDYTSESCLAPVMWPARNPVTLWTTTEFFVNWQVLVDRSTSSPNVAADGPAEVAEGTAHRFPVPATARATAACWAGLFVPDEGAPMFVDVDDSSNIYLSGDDQLRMSYMVWSYKHTPEFGNKQRDKYGYMSRDYARSWSAGDDTMTMPETGMWGMARGEFYFPPANQPDMEVEGEHEMWLFHPGWMGKLRPVHLPYESTNIADQSWDIEVPEMLRFALPTGEGLARTMFNIAGVPNYDGDGFRQDTTYLRDNVAPDMVGWSFFSAGDPHHYMDGMAK